MVIRLSELNQEQKDNYMNYYNNVLLTGLSGFKILEPEKEFNDFGLRFPIDYLNSVGKNIIMFPLEIMAEYCDVITKSYIDDKDESFIYEQIIDCDFNLEETYGNLNATGIGNLAYMALNCHNERAKEIANEQINSIFVKAKGELLNQINEAL